MNIFIVDADPKQAAIALADRHVVKMPLEAGQMLSTVLRGRGLSTVGGVDLYRATHGHHPCTLWAGTPQGFAWLVAHGLALCAEYTHRYGKQHASLQLIEAVAGLGDGSPSIQGAALCVPEEHRVEGDPVASYRQALRAKYAGWGTAARWTRRERPPWA